MTVRHFVRNEMSELSLLEADQSCSHCSHVSAFTYIPSPCSMVTYCWTHKIQQLILMCDPVAPIEDVCALRKLVECYCHATKLSINKPLWASLILRNITKSEQWELRSTGSS